MQSMPSVGFLGNQYPSNAACPFGSTKGDANDAALKQKADAFVEPAKRTAACCR
jgi:hypothetical protein